MIETARVLWVIVVHVRWRYSRVEGGGVCVGGLGGGGEGVTIINSS
jgi:hypothetical protein